MPKAGVAQFAGSTHWEENIAAVRRLAAKAAESGVNLLCFPELANTVYVPFVEDRALFRLAEPESGGSVAAARAIARQYELVLVYPFFEKDGDNFYNSAIVFGPRGEKLTKVSQAHSAEQPPVRGGYRAVLLQAGRSGISGRLDPIRGAARFDHLL